MRKSSKNSADFVLQRLRDWGIHRVFGYPGDGINSLLGALDRADGDPELIQPRHEEMGAFMATAHAKFTGEIGCCMATSGGGTIHLLDELYDAKLDHQPVVAIVGQGAAKASDQVAEILGAGVAKTSLGREVLPDDLPYVTGPIGLLGSTASHEMMMGADTLLFIGTSFPYTEWLPPEGQCKGVEIDIDGRMMGVRYPMDAQLLGDSRDTMAEMVTPLRGLRHGRDLSRAPAMADFVLPLPGTGQTRAHTSPASVVAAGT